MVLLAVSVNANLTHYYPMNESISTIAPNWVFDYGTGTTQDFNLT